MKKYLLLALSSILLMDCSSSNKSSEENVDWAKEAIWYQIFVERFHNGDPSNDPRPEDIDGCYPGYVPSDWAITPWTQDWYKPDAYFAGLDSIKDWGGNPVTDFNQKAQLRRYGGDLQGVLEKLDYIEELGITAIYFNPLNDAPSLHKYDARNWRHIDRNFGPNPDKDKATIAKENPVDPKTWQWTEADNMFLKVIDECHKRGIKVILDYSWNHTGHKFWAWEDVVQNQAQSPYKDWYWVQEFDDPATPESEFKYKGWFNVPDLPEIKETVAIDHTEKIVPFDGDIYSQEVKNHIFAITKRWLDPNGDGNPNDGVDGFRLDVAAELPLGFWKEYRTVVKNTKPSAYLVGEVWWEKFPDHLLDPAVYLQGDMFDAVMNYRWYRASRAFFNASPAISATAFADSLSLYQQGIDPHYTSLMMNVMASHDTPRVLTSLGNKNNYKLDTYAKNPNYYVLKPKAETLNTLKMVLIHQFTYVGAPHIWAGDEMGMWGADDPDTRKPLIWPEMTFDNETHHPYLDSTFSNTVQYNQELANFYKKLIQLRKQHKEWVYGEVEIIPTQNEAVLGYKRQHQNNSSWVLFNTSQEEQTITLPALPKDFTAEAIVVATQPTHTIRWKTTAQGSIMYIPKRTGIVLQIKK